MIKVRRAFADLEEGQVHYWHSSIEVAATPPLLVLHPGPGTARIQVPLLECLAEERRVIAPDLMGMGDSAPPPDSAGDPPPLSYYSDAVCRFLDVLGIDQCDVYGSSLGGRVAIDMAVSRPDLVRRLILGQVRIMKGEARADMAARHAPQVTPDQGGVYVQFLWSRLRDLYTYFPWFKRKAENMRRKDLPDAELMHIAFVEQMKMATTAYKAFAAYYAYDIEGKLPQIKAKTLVRGDEAVALIPEATPWDPAMTGDPLTSDPGQVRAFAAQILDFLKD
jgi:pimeloyl-ACP methyl ester carboxylesterase